MQKLVLINRLQKDERLSLSEQMCAIDVVKNVLAVDQIMPRGYDLACRMLTSISKPLACLTFC